MVRLGTGGHAATTFLAHRTNLWITQVTTFMSECLTRPPSPEMGARFGQESEESARAVGGWPRWGQGSSDAGFDEGRQAIDMVSSGQSEAVSQVV